MPWTLKDPPKFELKPLLSKIKFVFLGNNLSFLVIINNSLNVADEKKLLRVLSEQKTTIRWSITYIKGINPSLYMDKILMEKTFKPIVQLQKRLNPTIQEVV